MTLRSLIGFFMMGFLVCPLVHADKSLCVLRPTAHIPIEDVPELQGIDTTVADLSDFDYYDDSKPAFKDNHYVVYFAPITFEFQTFDNDSSIDMFANLLIPDEGSSIQALNYLDEFKFFEDQYLYLQAEVVYGEVRVYVNHYRWRAYREGNPLRFIGLDGSLVIKLNSIVNVNTKERSVFKGASSLKGSDGKKINLNVTVVCAL